MGFYGNITNTTRTTFTFDRVFPNRTTMDLGAKDDGIYIGRYVLIEYDKIPASNPDQYDNEFPENENPGSELLDKLHIKEGNTTFISNFNRDIDTYGASRGYDSTVWMKTYIDGEEKYVMIAELNTVVPTLDLEIDAPTQMPQKPFYDKDSNNIYYKIHNQPAWGFRVKAAKNYLTYPIETASGLPKNSGSQHEITEIPSWVSGGYGTQFLPSDENIKWTQKFRNETKFYRKEDGKWYDFDQQEKGEVESAIYYNKDGFNPDIDTNSNHNDLCFREVENLTEKNYEINKFYILNNGKYEKCQEETFNSELTYYEKIIADSISVSPSGYSGNLYKNNLGQEKFEIDTQELSIMLPSVGDTLNKVWNLTYGEGDAANNRKRNKDIAWEDAGAGIVRAGLRLNGNVYDTNHVDTIAGCINTIHDLIGMIIKPINGLEPDFGKINENYIYYNKMDNKYYYKYLLGPNETSLIPLEESGYLPVTVVNNINRNTPKWYKDLDNNYVYQGTDYSSIRNYYNINTTSLTPLSFKSAFKFKEWYVPSYGSGGKVVGYQTCEKNTNFSEVSNIYKATGTQTKIDTPIFIPNYYAVLEATSAGRIFKPAEKLEEGKIYYPIKLSKEDGVPDTIWVYREGEWIEEDIIKYDIDALINGLNSFTHNQFYNYNNARENGFVPFEEYNNDAKTLLYTKEGDVNESDIEYFKIITLDNFKQGTSFYTPIFTKKGRNDLPYEKGKYWVELPNKDYVLDFAEEPRVGVKYFYASDFLNNNVITTLIDDSIAKPYYLYSDTRNVYYIKDQDGKFVLNTEAYNSTTTYYINQYNELYVISDSANNFKTGEKWNNNVEKPNTVVLGTYKETYSWKELIDFAKTENTIDGLILKINDLLKDNDSYTRDRTTVQGCINVLNDYINKINTLTPGDVAIVDEMGRIHGASQSSKQIYQYRNLGTPKNLKWSTGVEGEDQWIYWNVNDDKDRPEITLEHRFHNNVTDTTTQSDKNIEKTFTNPGLNNSVGDTLDLYTPIVDNMGHVVGKNTETVTLPYGFKIFDATNSTSVSAAAPTVITKNIIADNTQDTFSFKTANDWLKFDTNTEDTLYITHKLSTVGTDWEEDTKSFGLSNTLTVKDLDDDNTFEIPYFTVDKAGHIIEAVTNTVSLPENFSKITISNISEGVEDLVYTAGSVEADNLTDELTISPANKWVKMAVDSENDKINIGHIVSDINTKAIDTTNLNLESGAVDEDNINIPDWNYDEAGHIISKQDHKYTLPFGFKTIKTNGVGSDTADIIISTTDVIADSTQDILTINSHDKWIKIATDAENDTITFAHEIHTVEPTTSTSDLTDNENSMTFEVPTYNFDVAGHYNGLDTKIITIPNSYGIFGADTGDDTTASATQDKISLLGDTWIKSTATKDTITFTHEEASTPIENKIDSETPSFGESFTIIDFEFDANGHKSGNGKSHTVTIPKGSLSDAVANGADVITQLNFVPSTGALTSTRTNIGALKLTDYEAPVEGNTVKIIATDTLNQALNKIEAEIIETNENIDGIKEALEDLKVDTSIDSEDNSIRFVSKVVQENGLISVETKVLPESSLTEKGIIQLSDAIDSDSTELAATANAVKQVADIANGAIQKTDDLLSYNTTEIKVPASISPDGTEQTDPKYYTIKDYIDTKYSNDSTFVYQEADEENEIEEMKMTIQQLFMKVAELEKKIKVLEDKHEEEEEELNPEEPDDSDSEEIVEDIDEGEDTTKIPPLG